MKKLSLQLIQESDYVDCIALLAEALPAYDNRISALAYDIDPSFSIYDDRMLMRCMEVAYTLSCARQSSNPIAFMRFLYVAIDKHLFDMVDIYVDELIKKVHILSNNDMLLIFKKHHHYLLMICYV